MSKQTLLVAFLLLWATSYQTFAQKTAKKVSKKSEYLIPTETAAGYVGNKIKDLQSLEKSFNFLVVGDWGRNGQYKQQDVADRMGEVAEDLDVQCILSTGDNFYWNGIASVEDPAWSSSFENIYTAHSLMVDWYPVLGNHDYRGNPQAEIDYTKRSRRWNMPARYYSIEKNLGRDGKEKILFVFLDTSPFDNDMYNARHRDITKQDSSTQKIWLDSTLANSNAKWKIVVGHHPLYTSGARIKQKQPFLPSIDAILEKYQVDFYFAGHEHDLQYQKPSNKITHHFVSGAGSEVRPTGSMEMTQFAASEHGFMAISLQNEQALLQIINEKGKILYKKIIKKF
jgi:tartrate-resistant acid phosphatase type 5